MLVQVHVLKYLDSTSGLVHYDYCKYDDKGADCLSLLVHNAFDDNAFGGRQVNSKGLNTRCALAT